MKELGEEKKYLENVISVLNNNIAENFVQIEGLKTLIQESKDQITQNFKEMEREEVSRHNVEIDENKKSILVFEKDNIKKQNQLQKPFFARIDFQTNEKIEKIYIGLGHVKDHDFLVYDWRAPVCSMYYDFNIGEASYVCEEGKTSGKIVLKRQFNIENQNLNYYIDTNETINDEILQEVLSNNTSSKMKDIVSTIQKEQNALIREDENKNIIVQGVAGSGKTSVALHRAGYLLYKNKEIFSNEDVLILSPSSLFSNYISEVLPQLGEDNIIETTFFAIAKRELDRPLQTRAYLVDHLCNKKSKTQLNNIALKSSFSFLEDLVGFLKDVYSKTFRPQDLKFSIPEKEEALFAFTKEELNNLYFEAYKDLEVYKRIEYMAEYLIERFNLKKKEFQPIKARFMNILYKFFPSTEIANIYSLFLSTKDIKFKNEKKYNYDDIAPLMVIKEFLFGFKHKYSCKYMIIDEMQDFSPCHFYLFNKLYRCPKLILGDINQCIEKSLTEEYLNLLAKYMKTNVTYLDKTYRSTKQIAEFSQKIIGAKNIKNYCRDGKKTEILKADNTAKSIIQIVNNAKKYYKHIAIICKTSKESASLYKQLEKNIEIYNLTELDDDSNRQVMITTATTSKGIEFDCVIIPFCEKENYKDNLDKNLLYISSTRALHELVIIYENELSNLIKR